MKGVSAADEAGDLQRIRENADMVVKDFGALSGLEGFGFNAPSVEWIEGFIERQRIGAQVSPEHTSKMVSILGSFLGECMIRTYGGCWALTDDGWRVEFDERMAVYPFTKVQKQFTNGAAAGDSIYGFFTAVPILSRRAAAPVPRHEPPIRPTESPSLFSRLRKWLGRGTDH